MRTLMHAFVRWLRDPFGKKDIAQKHAAMIQDMHAVTVVTERTNRRFISRHPAVRRRMGGANPIDQSILGTYKRTRTKA